MTDPQVAVGAAAIIVAMAVVLVWPTQRGPELSRPHAGGGGAGRASDPAIPTTTPDEIASAMVLLAVALQSGCGVLEAMERVADLGTDAAAQQLGVVAAALRWGVDDRRAWSEVDPSWGRTELALRLASASGVAPSSLLLEGASDLRSGQLAAVDVAAARVGVRLVLPLGLAFLPSFVLTTVVPVVLALTRRLLAEG